MKKFLAAAILAALVLPATPAYAGPPQREAALLHWLPQRAVLHAEIRADRARHRRILERRAERQAAREAAQAAAAASSTPSAVPSTSTYSGGCLSSEQVASYARGAGFPESAIPQMLYYADRESNFCPGAINSSSGACGLWQIYPAMPGCTDPAQNAAYAYAKYRASGFSPWGG